MYVPTLYVYEYVHCTVWAVEWEGCEKMETNKETKLERYRSNRVCRNSDAE